MPPTLIAAFRWFTLTGAVLSFLQATVLFGVSRRWLIDPWLRYAEHAGGKIPPLMRDARFQRGWPLFMSVFLGALWWWTGTPAGLAFLQQAK